MNVTKNVILDLLPLYLEGEASEDTEALVRDFLARHPELEPELLAGATSVKSLLEHADMPQDSEMRALHLTRRRVALRSTLLGLAVFASAMTLSFTFSEGGVRWLFAEQPVYAAACGVAAAALWLSYGWVGRRVRSSGL